jgi:phosphate transport system permease protein
MLNKKINNIEKRNAKERGFKTYGQLAIFFVLVFLVMLFSLIFYRASKALNRYELALEVDLTSYEKEIDLKEINFGKIIKNSLKAKLNEIQNLKEENWLYQIISRVADFELKNQIKNNRNLLGQKSIFWLPLSSKAEMYFKYKNASNINEKQLQWLSNFESEKQIRRVFNRQFFYQADSREPEIAGVGAGLIGSLMVMLIFLILAFPIAVSCAFYLEEFAKKNRFTDLIEISINNLAAIPSIIYGLLGLVLYLQIMHLPRSSSLVGGMTLFMLVLPVIIIATRNTIRSIPQNIRDGAYGLGASKLQVVLHHLLPLSMPGIMTGTILAVSRALGETAPLLMIGMVAFIADVANNFLEPTTALPVQIYLWSDLQEQGFVEKTALAILLLLGVLMLFNLTAIILRKKFEKKW